MHTSHLEALGPSVPAELSTAASALCEVAGSLIGTDETGAIAALELAARLGGADAALFVWVVPAQDEQVWFRSIAALDHRWGARVLRRLHEGPCNWLAHAARSTEPLLVREPPDGSKGSTASPHSTAKHAAWLVPAPSPKSSDALGLLILAGDDETSLDMTRPLLPVYRALALALSEWFQRRGREELLQRAQLTDRDLDLLRHEWMGHGSKRIAAALHVEAQTIDCRFHRLNGRLGVANRREAVRLCQRYGLL